MVVPAVEPADTIPLVEPIAAIDGSLLDHVPPDVELLNVLAPPSQAFNIPVIAPGAETTVSEIVLKHPVESEYKILVVPGDTPAATPEVGLIEATLVFVLLHVPPDVLQLNVVFSSSHKEVIPEIEAGEGLTVIITDLEHPLERTYEMTDVPEVTPVTRPDTLPIYAMLVTELIQVPPDVLLDKVVFAPTHKSNTPEMFAGLGFIVTIEVDLQPVDNV